MKSGDYTVSRDDAYYTNEFSKISDSNFVSRVFLTRTALVAKLPVNGHRCTKDYHGGLYDENVFDLVDGTWDHEHCFVCWFSIRDGHSYWENGKRINLLCDACYEAYKKTAEQGAAPN
jgi:hypothetical protein